MNGPTPFGDPVARQHVHTEVPPVDPKLLEEAKRKIAMMEKRQRERDAANKPAYAQPTPPVLRPSPVTRTVPQRPPHEPDEAPEVRRVDGPDGKIHWERVDEE